MLRKQSRATLIFCTLSFLFFPDHHATFAWSNAESHVRSTLLAQSNNSVFDWFAAYDQIRRDAEMTMGDKLQSRSLSADKPDKKGAALASRMLKKYAIALAAMKELPSIPETKELQDGYTEYFDQARQLFSNYLEAQEKVPFVSHSLVTAREKLQDLDAKNKTLDKELRKKHGIKKHKHS